MRNKKLNLSCHFCQEPLRLYNAYFEIYDRDKRGELVYPGGGDLRVQNGKWQDYERVVLFAHGECGPDSGYAFSFTRLGEDWDAHLRGKSWWVPTIPGNLDRAREASQIVQTEYYKTRISDGIREL